MQIKVNDGAVFSKGELTDAGYDMCNAGKAVRIPPGSSVVIGTGVSIRLPPHIYGALTHRSSLAWKKDCILSYGVIDSSYTKEIKAKVFNLGPVVQYIERGERFCQLIPSPLYQEHLELVDDWEDDGKDGFGSSGK